MFQQQQQIPHVISKLPSENCQLTTEVHLVQTTKEGQKSQDVQFFFSNSAIQPYFRVIQKAC